MGGVPRIPFRGTPPGGVCQTARRDFATLGGDVVPTVRGPCIRRGDMSQSLAHVLRMWADDGASRELGMVADVIEVDHAVVRMTLTEAMVNGHDIAHGGFIFTLADSTFALACNSRGTLTVAAGADITFVTSVRRGDVLVADGRVRAAYGRSGITDVTVTRESDGALVAEFRGRSRSLPRR